MSLAIGTPPPVNSDANVIPDFTADRIGPANQP